MTKSIQFQKMSWLPTSCGSVSGWQFSGLGVQGLQGRGASRPVYTFTVGGPGSSSVAHMSPHSIMEHTIWGPRVIFCKPSRSGFKPLHCARYKGGCHRWKPVPTEPTAGNNYAPNPVPSDPSAHSASAEPYQPKTLPTPSPKPSTLNCTSQSAKPQVLSPVRRSCLEL